MLQITIPATECWDESKQEFFKIQQQTIQLEHSLVSLSKWESKWNKIFLSKDEKTVEEILDYVKCMTVTPNVDSKVYYGLTAGNFKQINDYIEAPMTATTFNEMGGNKPNRERITSELIYYWMIALNIPFECQKWHLNRLLTLIRICNIKNQPPKKMGKKAVASNYAAINAARRKQLNTTG